MGVVGLETAFAVMYTELVMKDVITLEKLVELMSINPRKRFGFEQTDDFAVFDVSEKYEVRPEEFKTKGRATPFEGKEVFGKCLLTVCDGEIVYRSI